MIIFIIAWKHNFKLTKNPFAHWRVCYTLLVNIISCRFYTTGLRWVSVLLCAIAVVFVQISVFEVAGSDQEVQPEN